MARTRLAALAVVGPALLAACSGAPAPAGRDGVSIAAATPTCVPETPAPVAVRSLSFPLPAGTLVTNVHSEAGRQLVTGRVPGSVTDVLGSLRAAGEQAGFVVQSSEDEGRSARLTLFGTAGTVNALVVGLRCPAGVAQFTVYGPQGSGSAPSPTATGPIAPRGTTAPSAPGAPAATTAPTPGMGSTTLAPGGRGPSRSPGPGLRSPVGPGLRLPTDGPPRASDPPA